MNLKKKSVFFKKSVILKKSTFYLHGVCIKVGKTGVNYGFGNFKKL